MTRPQTSDTAVTTTPIQFIVPLRAVDVIDIGALIREATEDGVVRPLIAVSPFGMHARWAQVTCPVEMALRLVNAWREAAGSTTVEAEAEERLAVLRRAVVAAYRAYDKARGVAPEARHPE